jgi:hypothetical protein
LTRSRQNGRHRTGWRGGRGLINDDVDAARHPRTVGREVPGWNTHDIEGLVVAMRAGTLLLSASSVLALHALVCDHDEKADGDLIPATLSSSTWCTRAGGSDATHTASTGASGRARFGSAASISTRWRGWWPRTRGMREVGRRPGIRVRLRGRGMRSPSARN